jgi:hypothetical protein
MDNFATIEDIRKLWRALTPEEEERASALLQKVSSILRSEADKVGKDIDLMIQQKPYLADVAASVTVDVVARALATPTNQEPVSQFTESAMGYSYSGTYLVPGGGVFIKKAELARLGLKRQKMGGMKLWGDSGEYL